MNFLEAIRMSLDSLRASKMRSILTLVGIVIGVMTVIAVVSIINGLNTYVATKIFNLGADVFILSKSPNVILNIDDWTEAQKRKDIRLEDFEAVRAACEHCSLVGAATSRRGMVRYSEQFLRDVTISGWSAAMPDILDIDIASGRALTESDDEHKARFCVVGTDIVDNLFPTTDPLGKEVKIDDEPYLIVGVAKKLGSTLGQSRDNFVTIPVTSHLKQYGPRRSLRIFAKSYGESTLDAAQDEVRLIMRARRHVPYLKKDDFAIETNQTFLEIWGNISRAFFLVTVVIASISLIVGGVVIMNIMLVSVTERTREIGIRKAIGARRHDILLQFLIESSTLSLVGGLWGILVGVLIAKIVSWATPLPTTIELWSVVMGLVISTSIGLFFGIYPATRAARLDPIVALRYEL
ncbi:MAG: ABC transporter permease [Acidobacteriia bacterium]|nr:ABC transporter permease [Terriglobia bacterium]